VSALADGTVDRGALAKSVLASRSLLERNEDVGRLLDGLRVPYTTTTEPSDRKVTTDAAWSNSRKDQTPKTGLQKNRFNSHVATPQRQESNVSVSRRISNITDHLCTTGQLDSNMQVKTQTHADRSEPTNPQTRTSRFVIATNEPENVNTSATLADIKGENPQTVGDVLNSLKTSVPELEVHKPLGLTDLMDKESTQMVSMPTDVADSQDRRSGQLAPTTSNLRDTRDRTLSQAGSTQDQSDSKNKHHRRSSKLQDSLTSGLPDLQESSSTQAGAIDRLDSKDKKASKPQGSIPTLLPDSQLGAMLSNLPDHQNKSSPQEASVEDVRSSVEPTKVAKLKSDQAEDAALQKAAEAASGASQRPVSAIAAETKTPVSTATLPADSNSNAKTQVTQEDTTGANSALPPQPRQGQSRFVIHS